MSIQQSLHKKDWDNLLFSYAKTGGLYLLKDTHEHGADIHCKNEAEQSLLHVAAEYGQVECVRYLCSSGLDINGLDHGKWTPLHLAAMNGQLECVKALIQYGADDELMNNIRKTAVELAGNSDVIGFLKSASENKKLSQIIDGEFKNEVMEF